MAAVGAGGSSKEELAEGEIAANGGGGERKALPNLRRKFSVVGGAGTKGARIENPPRASWFASGAKNTATTLSSKTSNCTARRSMLS